MDWKFLLLIAVVATIEAAKPCTNLHPGMSKIVRGVDITKLDLLPLQVVGNDGILSPVFPLTCDQGKQWKNPAGKVYEKPDQIWHITSFPGGWLSSEVSTYTSYNEVRKSMSANVGLEANVGKFGFSASFSYRKMQSSITNSSRYLSVVTAYAGTSRVDMIPSTHLELDKFTRHYIDTEMTGTFETNPAAYNKFIATYGTHYFDTANFGGFVRMLFETNKEYFLTRSEEQIEASAKASFMMLAVNAGGSSGSSYVEKMFRSNSKTTIKYYGGDTNLLNSQDGFSKWQPTVEKDPWLFSGKLKPISDLIKDPTKKASMVRAVENHLIRSYLEEMESLINAARARSDNAIIHSFMSRLADLKSRKTINESAVDALSRDLEENVSVPQWFVDNTKICLHWWGTSDWLQCGGGGVTPQDLCAYVNEMTPWYQDWTDSRWGGCKMQWAIFSSKSHPPAWLSKVKMCFQWYAEDNIDQCGGDRGQTFCSDINSYTQKYFDDTGSRSGGCQMRWMIQFPDDAPYWTKAVQMCYYWEANGNSQQCGGSAPPRQCVLANQWTQYYLDYTDDRWGGCKMSWGLRTSSFN